MTQFYMRKTTEELVEEFKSDSIAHYGKVEPYYLIGCLTSVIDSLKTDIKFINDLENTNDSIS